MTAKTKFSPGAVFSTSNANETLNPADVVTSLARHLSGDWGDVCEEDQEANNNALENEGRILSSYFDRCDVKFWIITEWDRSATTILLPEDY